MTAKEKFEDKLSRVGLLDDWKQIGERGKVAKFAVSSDENPKHGRIMLFVHEYDKDSYTEIHYPPFNALRENKVFVNRCADEFLSDRMSAFVSKTADWDFNLAVLLCSWLLGDDVECPLSPVDVYFPGEGLWDYCRDFSDDVGIMNTLNNHNPELVREINEKWDKFKERFKPVLCALYERDIDEITDADSFQIERWINTPEHTNGRVADDWSGYNALALSDMIAHWDEFAENYLMHIADDQDLKTILTFVRYDVCEETGRDWISVKDAANSPLVAPTYLDGTPWHKCNSYEELEKYIGKHEMENVSKEPKWWCVGKFSDGVLWMNNDDGRCYLECKEPDDIYYARVF